MNHVSKTNFALGASGFTFTFGRDRKIYYLTVANDLVAGQLAGTAVVLTVGSSRDQWTIPYGSVKTIPLTAGTWKLSGSGAFVEIDCSDEPVSLTVQTIQIPTITGVSATITADNVGLAKTTDVKTVALAASGGIYQAPLDGTVWAQLEGSGAEPTLKYGGGAADKINGGAVLAAGTANRFGPFPVRGGDQLTFGGVNAVLEVTFQPSAS